MTYGQWEVVKKIEEFDKDILNRYLDSDLCFLFNAMSSVAITSGIANMDFPEKGTAQYFVSIALLCTAVACNASLLYESIVERKKAKQIEAEKEKYKKSLK